jgi:hypothetical protein
MYDKIIHQNIVFKGLYMILLAKSSMRINMRVAAHEMKKHLVQELEKLPI